MNSLNYLLQTNLYLILFIGFYTLVLRNETFFKQNRIFLNGSVLLSFLIPFTNSGWFRDLFVTRKVREATELIPVQMIYDPVEVTMADAPQWTTTEVINLVYLSGAIVFLIRFLIQLLWLNYNLTEKQGAAFSFFKKLVVDSELAEKDTIINHEKVHIRQWHSLDVILIELAAIINWFNPVMYLYKKEIKHIHEFIADEEASAVGQSKSEYALLLLSSTLGIAPHQLTNSFFNQSLLKRRIFMLSKNRSRRVGLLKYGLAAPLFAAMLIFSAAAAGPYHPAMITATQKISNSLTGALSAQDEPDDYQSFLKRNPDVKELAWKINPYRVIVYLKNGRTETYNMDNRQEKDKALSRYGELPYPPPPPPAPPASKQTEIPLPVTPDTPPPPPAKPEANSVSKPDIKLLSRFISRNIVYPAMARDNNVSAHVVAGFNVSDNLIRDIKIHRGAGYGMDEEVVRAFSKYRDPVDLENGTYTLGVLFQLKGAETPQYKADLNNLPNYLGTAAIIIGYSEDYRPPHRDSVHNFSSVNWLPEFPGGEKGFKTFLSENIKYPPQALKNNITGRVFVEFIVERDGSLSNLRILRGLGYGTDEEALRVLKKSPRWKPGMTVNKEPVRVRYVIPIQFQRKQEDSPKSNE